ncbi:MAG: ADP-heptose--LPS heptosyltransferase [Acidobacteria bacterium]|nr:ADP-heptose--LPS heptosyltransferase [Acidobacteriota bacterium]
MRRGDFAAAWKISDALLPLARAQDHRVVPRHLQNIWDGTPLEGKRVLGRCYHGLGDTIQFIRYAALLKHVAGRVVVWVQPSLIPLLRGVEGIDELLPLRDGVPDVEYDVDVELNELPYVFRTTLANVPAEVPYLHVEPVWLGNTEKFRVGLIWQSGEWEATRSIPFRLVQPLAQFSDIQWHILQRDAVEAGWNGAFGVISGGDNPLDDARVMRALDLVISVDTMTAHLAGALGCKTWTLLPFEADWRWMCDREDSPWYPTMRLFRQKQEGNWEEVIGDIGRELTKVVAQDRRQFAAARPDL